MIEFIGNRRQLGLIRVNKSIESQGLLLNYDKHHLPGPYVVVVEGPTERGFFEWFSRQLITDVHPSIMR